MTVKLITLTPETTYRGAHGLLIAGHVYSLTESQVAAIQAEVAKEQREFKFRTIKNAAGLNRAPKKKKDSKPE